MQNVKYEWAQDAQITFSGAEFEAMVQTLAHFQNSPLSPASIGSVDLCARVLAGKLQSMVKDGIATPATEETTDKSNITLAEEITTTETSI